MARMHARKRGKSGSVKPPKSKPEWLEYSKEEVKKIIAKLSKEGLSAAQIGTVLRDSYGIPAAKIYGIRVSTHAAKKEVPEDLYNLLVKSVNLHKHLAENKRDAMNRHNIQLVESKIRRLAKYYVRKGSLPEGWKYTLDSAKLIVR